MAALQETSILNKVIAASVRLKVLGDCQSDFVCSAPHTLEAETSFAPFAGTLGTGFQDPSSKLVTTGVRCTEYGVLIGN